MAVEPGASSLLQKDTLGAASSTQPLDGVPDIRTPHIRMSVNGILPSTLAEGGHHPDLCCRML